LRTKGGHPWIMSDWQHYANLICLLARDVQMQDVTWRSTDAVKVKRKVHADGPKAVKDRCE